MRETSFHESSTNRSQAFQYENNLPMSESSNDNEHLPAWSSSTSVAESSNSKCDGDDANALKRKLSQQETKQVFRLKLIVVAILLLAASGVSALVYILTESGQEEEFESQYEGTAEKISNSFEGILQRVGAISSVGVAATLHGMDRNDAEWPFITLSSFQQRSATARLLSGAIYVKISPLVTFEQRSEWEKYVVGPAKFWIQNGLDYQRDMEINDFEHDPPPIEEVLMLNRSSYPIWYYNSMREVLFDSSEGPYLPSWLTSPVLKKDPANENILRRPDVAASVKQCLVNEEAIFGDFEWAPSGTVSDDNPNTAFFASLRSIAEGRETEYLGDPMARLYLPVFNNFSKKRKIVAVMMAVIQWRQYMREILPPSVEGVIAVLENTCDGYFTYEINGPEAAIVGFGDHHDARFDKYKRTATFDSSETIVDGTRIGLPLGDDGCSYQLHVYPSDKFYSVYHNKTPALITFAVAMVFAFTISMFFFYDTLVEKRQRLILSKAAKSTAIVSSLFPKNIGERLLDENEPKQDKRISVLQTKNRLKGFLTNNDEDASAGQQIADLYPNCTVLFADIAGFTAWSSTREPEQVFVLLQTVYQCFDQIAKRRKVFKVETIGDCYLAVTGLPDPQSNHAVIMARFAWECRLQMNIMTKELEVALGPDTGDLAMRVGLHSGPITAGVLRGDRARFQLFGDTVNTGARMESTGVKDKIQISQATADLLIGAGKSQWISPREDKVEAKGKGSMKTFWLVGTEKARSSSGTASEGGSVSEGFANHSRNDPRVENEIKQQRLVDWMVEILSEHLRKMVAKRKAEGFQTDESALIYARPSGKTCLDEVQEVILMTDFDRRIAESLGDYHSIDIPENVVASLREYVQTIAKMYRDNHFHNFEHACHVTMSVNKLLKRIASPELTDKEIKDAESSGLASHLHKYSYGITSDPLAVFAIVFSALIHDVDHRGCSNMQLMKEEEQMAKRYRKKSAAEQNSLDLSWDLLMTNTFADLRKYIFGTKSDLMRFRQFIVNTVLATDIFDKELNDIRKIRWAKAFAEGTVDSNADHVNRKATIVIEHIIQASDVSHTMQHWHVYRKWNQLLFKEMHAAFKVGRLGANPADFWYKGEIGFFDNYVIPLAKKLKECNVFGVSSDEYLNYAIENRNEWVERGEGIVEELMEEIKNGEPDE